MSAAPAYLSPVAPASIQHALVVLRNELAVLRDGHRALIAWTDRDMSPAQRDHFITSNLREIREVQEAIRRLRAS